MTKLLLAVTLLAARHALALGPKLGPHQVQSGTIAHVPGLTQGAPYSAEIFYPSAAFDTFVARSKLRSSVSPSPKTSSPSSGSLPTAERGFVRSRTVSPASGCKREHSAQATGG